MEAPKKKNKSWDYLINAVLIAIICFFLGIIGVYIIMRLGGDTPEPPEHVGLIEQLSEDRYIYVDDDGLFGIADGESNIILTAEWNSIEPLWDDSSRFIVSNKANGIKKGIIDSDGNLISPYIYTEIVRMNEGLLIAYTTDSRDSAVLLDGSGNRYANEEWDSVQCYSGNYLILTKNDYEYSAVIENGKLLIRIITYTITVLEKDTAVSILPGTTMAQIDFDSYNKIITRTRDFITALCYENRNDFLSYCTEEFGATMLEMSGFQETGIESIRFINPEIVDSGGEMQYFSTVYLTPGGREAIGHNIEYAMRIAFEFDEDGKILVAGCEIL